MLAIQSLRLPAVPRLGLLFPYYVQQNNRTIFLALACPIRWRRARSNQQRGTRHVPLRVRAGYRCRKFLVLWSQDTFGVTSDRESRNCHDSVDEITRVAYQNRQVEWRLPLVNERQGSCAIRVQSVGSRSRTPDRCNVAIDRDCIHLCQI